VPILPRLVALYESRGINVVTGLNPSHFKNFPHAPFTWFVKDGGSLTNGLGIAQQEVYFLECLFARFHPKSIFVIGNSLGWSTLALALANPQAKVLAIDAGFDRHSREGLDFTNRVAAEEGLTARAVIGKSPEDVARLLRDEAMPLVDFAFIDGYHAVEQVPLDVRAVRPHAALGCIYLFHDVVSFGLAPGVERIAAETGLSWQLLRGTTSGMAIAWDETLRPPGLDDIAPFIVSEPALTVIDDAAWAHRHRHLARWRRSLRKRLGRTARGSR
jgi:predicted O-methyltransferase YrrM